MQFAARALRFSLCSTRTIRAKVLRFANRVAAGRGYFDSRAPDRLAAIEVKTSLSSLATCTS